MNNESLKLIIELAKENPNIDTDKLLQLSGVAEQETKQLKEGLRKSEKPLQKKVTHRGSGNRSKKMLLEGDGLNQTMISCWFIIVKASAMQRSENF